MSDEGCIRIVAKCKILFSEIADPTSKYNRDRKKYLANRGVNLLNGFVFTQDPIDGSITIFQKVE